MEIDNQDLSTTENQDTGATEEQSSEEKAQEILDLGTVERFRFKDKEWTPDDIEKAILRQEDYTRKTQGLAEERKYYDNLSADLEHIKLNPSLAARFKEVYPEKFHGYLNYVMGQAKASGQATSNTESQQGIDPKVLSRLESVEKRFYETDVKAKEEWLDAQFTKNQSKYPFAQEAIVIAKAQARLERKEALDDKAMEDIFKEAHAATEKMFKEHQKTMNTNQLKANAKGRDVPKGGGIPGQAPVVARTIKEAQEIALRSFGDN